MSDEQTRLLQAILDAVKEQTAFTNQCRGEALAAQSTVLARAKLLTRFGLVFMLVTLAFLAYSVTR